MEPKKVIRIDEESFKDKALEIIQDMHDKGGPHLPLVAMLAFIELQQKLFYPQEAPEKTEQE